MTITETDNTFGFIIFITMGIAIILYCVTLFRVKFRYRRLKNNTDVSIHPPPLPMGQLYYFDWVYKKKGLQLSKPMTFEEYRKRNEKLIINVDGYVGLGNYPPYDKLDVIRSMVADPLFSDQDLEYFKNKLKDAISTEVPRERLTFEE